MIKYALKVGIIGAVVIFIWQTISWMALPLHDLTMHIFENPTATSKMIADAARHGAGVYISRAGNISDKPIIFAIVSPKGMNPMGPMIYLQAVAIQFIAAFLLGLMIVKAQLHTLKCKVIFGAMLGLFSGVVIMLPLWHWWNAPLGFVTVVILDLVIGWTLVAFAISKLKVPACKK